MKWSLVSLEPLDPDSETVEDFINDIAFGTSLFVSVIFKNTYFQL